MGGDAFQGIQKLTNEEYLQIIEQIKQKLRYLCQRIQPYIPLPQKQIHGDIDFLILLKSQYKIENILKEINNQKYILHNNYSLSSVYKNKQIDYLIVKSNEQFQMTLFYKSHSGFGGYLGYFLPSKEIKLTHSGLFALKFNGNVKIQFLLTINVDQILKFYGLQIQTYHKGFKTRSQIYQYMRQVRFLDQKKYAYFQGKGRSKIMTGFQQYLKTKGFNKQYKYITFNNALQQTLKYFNKKQDYEQYFQNYMKPIRRIQQLNYKFNGKHILSKFNISTKQLQKFKKIFQQNFLNKGKYYQYIEQKNLQTIIQYFGQVCNLQLKI